MTYPEAIDFLYSLRLFGTKFGLENIRELSRLNGNPHEKLRFIHVAGTNGKGSTCAILESIYRANGLKTGLFSSPHLVSFTERIQINRQPISEDDVSRITAAIMDSLGGRDFNQWFLRPTFFEFVTIMALRYFQEKKCDLVIWETGLGGRLDATNIVLPLASVITNIQYDHQAWLGNTLEEIAREKAGIIKPRVPVLTATSPGPALDVIRETAEQNKAPLIEVQSNNEFALQFKEPLSRLPLRGEHQICNATLAIAVTSTLSSVLPVSAEAIHRGTESVHWAGRLQLIERGPSILLLDGAHNPDGAKSLAASIPAIAQDRPITVILGLFRDKDWQEMCDQLAPLAARLFLVPVSSERTADPSEVQTYCRAKWPSLEIASFGSLGEALDATVSHPFVVVAGSLHLIGEAMEHLRVSPGVRSERGLNEWDATNSARTGGKP
ncbi:MAG TPA: folylpolyglutamate synthase/dihydrofolate synthase family protein [Candidatus Kapabacteria bacterium]|nr:folylpolyglutamate synthase/dihydrofolate synthase family protein [Candidatus Kapabacteria bacterium]